MSAAIQTKWRIAGQEAGSCNCAWGCPCQFNALPTYGNCEALIAFRITKGYFGETRLDSVTFAKILWWPGPVHEGNGIRQLVVDDRATRQQREALTALDSGLTATPIGRSLRRYAPRCWSQSRPRSRSKLIRSGGARPSALAIWVNSASSPSRTLSPGKRTERASSCRTASSIRRPRWLMPSLSG
jgi:uncharacterized protein DUF1326